jgi:uncharacterized membrane protein
MRIDESVTIDATREQVWGAVSNPATAQAFLDGMRFATVDGEPEAGPRARYAVRTRVGSAEVGGLVEVTEWDPPHELAWTSITGIDQRGRWIMREQGPNRTKVTFRLGYQAPGGVFAVLADRVSSRMVKKNVRSSLAALKRMLEVKHGGHV